MNIGILTHSLATNYGANLQAISTAYYLRNHGYNPIFFNWNVYMREVDSRMNQEQVKMHTSFLRSHGFEVTNPCYTDDDFNKIIKSKTIHNIIVGSDAVLTVKPFIDSIRLTKKGIKWGGIKEDYYYPNPFWCNFLGNEKEIRLFLMSPSCQSSRYKLLSHKTKRSMANQLNKFFSLSARDAYTQQMICDISGMEVSKVPITPDPVWNFNENVGFKVSSKKDLLLKYHINDENYLIVSFYPSFVNLKFITGFEEEAQKHGYHVYFLPMPQDNCNYPIDTIQLPIDSLDYYALIKYSKGYIGNNMHPVICAIHNNVPFVSIDQHGKWYLHGLIQNSKSSKVYDLLSRFSLDQNRINQSDLSNYNYDDLLDILESTDLSELMTMSQELRNQYCTMMENITTNFI